MIGATVLTKGADKGTITDIDGQFIMSVDRDSMTLVFKYIGFATKEAVWQAGKKNYWVVKLKESALLLLHQILHFTQYLLPEVGLCYPVHVFDRDGFVAVKLGIDELGIAQRSIKC